MSSSNLSLDGPSYSLGSSGSGSGGSHVSGSGNPPGGTGMSSTLRLGASAPMPSQYWSHHSSISASVRRFPVLGSSSYPSSSYQSLIPTKSLEGGHIRIAHLFARPDSLRRLGGSRRKARYFWRTRYNG